MKTVSEKGNLGVEHTTIFSVIWSWIKYIKGELVSEFPDKLAFIWKWEVKGQHCVKIVISIRTPSFFVFRFGIHIV